MIKPKRVALITAAIVTAVAASLLLITALLAAAQPAPNSPSTHISKKADIHISNINNLANQTISITFPTGNWPWYAQEEISVHPEPPIAGHPTELCAEVINLDPAHPHTAALEFRIAAFGIGTPFAPVGLVEVIVPPGGHAQGCVVWVPPAPGHWNIEALLMQEGAIEPMRSQRNIDIWEPLIPGQEDMLSFPVGPFPEITTISFTAKNVPPGWGVAIDPISMTLPADQPGYVDLITLPPIGEPLGSRQVIVDVEGYVNGEVIGGFRKFDWPPVPLHRAKDPFFAESEISVWPYPPRAGEPTELCVELFNISDLTQTVEIGFSWANFGIGLPFQPVGGPITVEIPPHDRQTICTWWVPPFDGQFCVQVRLDILGPIEYHPQFSQRNLDVDEPLKPGVPHAIQFPVGNFFNEFTNPNPVPTDIWLEPDVHLPDWQVKLIPTVLPNMAPNEERMVTMIVTPALDLPPDGTPALDVRAFIDDGPGPRVIGGFRKIFRPPVPIHQPQDPIYAESEIFVHPYPPRAHEPMELGAEIRNPTDEPQTVTVTFSVAEFGIGLPFAPIHEPIVVHLLPHSLAYPSTMWIPPDEGLWCFQVEIEMPGYDEIFYSQRNMDVGEPLEPNIPHSRPFPVGNPFPYPVTITLGLIPHFPDWGLDLSSDILPDMAPGEVRVITLTVTPPNDLPGDGDPIVDVEAYVEGQLIGGFRKIFRPPVPIHRPRDPVYAESEIGVDPYPVIPGQPTQLSVEVFNPTDDDHIVTVTFSVAPFGIGLPFSVSHILPNPIHIFVPAHGAARGHVIWEPPAWRGKFCVRVELQMEGHEMVWSQRNIDVGEPLEPGQPHSLVFPVGNWPYTDPVSITLGTIAHLPDWGIELSETSLTNVTAGAPVTVTLTVTPPLGVLLGTGVPIVDVEAFVDGALLGGFRKMDIPPVPLHKPHEKGYAESEISIIPYPPQLGQDVRVSTVVQNSSEQTMTVELEFGWAKFGMGIPFTTTGMSPYTRSVELSPEMTATAWVTWTPSLAGSQCVVIRLNAEGYEPQESQRNVHVEERPPCGQTQVFTFTVRNDSAITSTVDIGLITFDVPTDWTVTVVPSDTLELGPYSEGVITVTVHIPCPATSQVWQAVQQIYAIQEAAGGTPTVDVEGYIDGSLVGGIELQFQGGVSYRIYLPVVMRP